MPRIIICLALLLVLSVGAYAVNLPEFNKPVIDLAGILTPEQTTALDAKLRDLYVSDSTQIGVLIIPSLEGESLEDVSIRAAGLWKLGQKGQNNGALLFIAMKERKIRIEVGYGLEATLTDALSAHIRMNVMTPRFKEGDYYGGIDSGITAIIQTVRGVYQPSADTRTSASRQTSKGIFNLIIILLFPLFWILSSTGKWGGGIIGAGAGVLLPYTLISHSWIPLLLGGALGGVAGIFLGALVSAGSRSSHGPGGFGGPFIGGGGGFFGGGFSGGGGFGGGGFSGGGGSFGGGGSSGSW
jgi:uncharacterized protein